MPRPRIEVFSDFDGTISLEDTGCILIDTGIGKAKREAMDVQIMAHELTFLKAMDYWWSHVELTFEEALELLRPAHLDPGFLSFYAFIQSHKIPFSIVSCGLDVIIQQYMGWHLGEEEAAKLNILANHGKVEGRRWLVTYWDESPHSHDKSVCIQESKQEFKKALVERQEQKERAIEAAATVAAAVAGEETTREEEQQQEEEEHIVVFCGDGISDLSAAREADVLFVRKGRNLETYCRTHKIPFTPFDTFEQVKELIQGLQDGSLTMIEVHRRQQEECERS
ncbi:hypothetical protein BGZ65_007294 [Modicella reniformis]|uniref:Uncharacterized protein n=1 Tax=Modicella reniformis TaxID=1440133 RepID=A0A9P6J563_9FUNG|nr:hypothetical protein BGZ65_007294 [Modicella reniformis]